MTDLLKLARDLVTVATGAGRITLQYHRNNAAIMDKLDGSPVTIADQEAEAFIVRELQILAPEIPIVGEEGVAAGYIPDISGGTFFLVDALDGTREFISGGDDYTVNIALMKDFMPVMGVISVPVRGITYFGAAGQAFAVDKDGKEEKISVRPVPEEGLTVVGSSLSDDPNAVQKFLEGRKVKDFVKLSSSLKFCAVATGEADFFPRMGPTCEWDIAAGEAILNAAGGVVTQLDGKPMVYGKLDRKFLNTSFVAHAA